MRAALVAGVCCLVGASLRDAAAAEPAAPTTPATPTLAVAPAAPAPAAASFRPEKPVGPDNLPPIEKLAGPTRDVASLEDRPRVAGTLRLVQRSRRPVGTDRNAWEVVEQPVDWPAAETAIIVCDMWDDHYCVSAAQRVGVMAPKMNRVLTEARAAGVLVVHAPSGVTEAYADWPQRHRMQQAPRVEPPVPLGGWCHLDPEREPELPVDTSQCACDDPVPRPAVRFFRRQHPGLDILGHDGLSDRGDEIYHYFRKLGIKHVALMGVHANMCVLGRPFGIRQQVRLGMHVVLVRDLTDAMYDPRQPPYVSHARGTELVVEHIEKYWCPSIDSADLTRVVPGTAGP